MLNPVYMIFNEFSALVYVYLDIKMVYSKICQHDSQYIFNLVCNVLYFPFYFHPEGHLFIKWVLSTEARSTPEN